MSDVFQVRLSIDEERPSVEALSQMDRSVKEFKFTWHRWGNWGRHNPIVVVETTQNMMVGFHAAAFGRRSGYVNSYYQFVAQQYQGHGLGAQMVAFILQQAPTQGCLRMKFKVPKVSAGRVFWEGFNLRPFAEDSHHVLFDVKIEGITSVEELMERASTICSFNQIPEASLKKYTAKGVTFLS